MVKICKEDNTKTELVEERMWHVKESICGMASYLLASEHVKGFNLSPKYLIS